MTKIWVDFNDRDGRGLLPSSLKFVGAPIAAGETVMAEDGEGNRCEARVFEIAAKSGLVYLDLDHKTFIPIVVAQEKPRLRTTRRW